MASPQQRISSEQNINAAEIELLKQLSRLIVDLTRAGSECRRISRGSPGAGQLSGSTQHTRSRLNEIKSRIDNVLDTHARIPGARGLKTCYTEFDGVLNELVDEGGNDHGYTTRVHYLERVNYHSGVVKGRADALVEIMEYWQERAREQEQLRSLFNGLQGNRNQQPTTVLKTEPVLNNGSPSAATSTKQEPARPMGLSRNELPTAVPKIEPGLTSRPPVTLPTPAPRTNQPAWLTSRLAPGLTSRPLVTATRSDMLFTAAARQPTDQLARNSSSTVASGGLSGVVRRLTFSDEDTTVGPNAHEDNGDISVSINLCSTMCSQLANLFRSQQHSDVTFIIGTHRVPAHRIVLAAQSEYFDRLLFGGMKEAKNEEVEIREVRVTTFECLLKYTYTGRVEIKAAHLQDVLELIEVSDRFCFLKLKDALASQLAGLISISTVFHLLVCANRLGLEKLQEACFNFVDKNAAAVLKGDALFSLNEDLMVRLLSRDSFVVEETAVHEAVVRWMQENASSQQSDGLIRCIRLSEIPPHKLLDLAGPDGMFTDRAVLASLRIQMKKVFEDMNPRGRIVKDNTNLFDNKDAAKVQGSVYWRQKLLAPNQPPPPQQQPPQAIGGLGLTLGNRPLPPQQQLPQGISGLGLVPVHQPLQHTGLFGSAPATQHITYNGVPNIPLSEVVMATLGVSTSVGMNALAQFSTTGLQQGGLQSPPVPSSLFSVTVVFDSVYLLNYLLLKPYPEEPAAERPHLGFSYTVEISQDDSNWMMLFDYSSYTCYSTQSLVFPKQAIRYLRLRVVKLTDKNKRFTISLSSCSLIMLPSMLFRANGVMAPLSPRKTMFTNRVVESHGAQPPECQVTLHRPYSITCIKLMLNGKWSQGSVGDVTLTWGMAGGQLLQQTLTNKFLQMEMSVVFAEQVVNFLTVKVSNVINPSNHLTLLPAGEDTFTVSEVVVQTVK